MNRSMLLTILVLCLAGLGLLACDTRVKSAEDSFQIKPGGFYYATFTTKQGNSLQAKVRFVHHDGPPAHVTL